MSFIIRQAMKSDAGAISRLITGMAHYFLADPVAADAQPFLITLKPLETTKRIEAASFRHFIAEDTAGLCGVIAVRDGSHVYHLFVHPAKHRQGIARALWEHARAESGKGSFTVNSSLFAVPVYQRLGFTSSAGPKSANGLVFVPMVYGDEI
jgi:GNAT superfamily N-acetyltransferase